MNAETYNQSARTGTQQQVASNVWAAQPTLPMNRLNENEVAALRDQIAATAKALRSRELPFLDGVRQLYALGHEVSQTGHDEDFMDFVVIESETDHIPKSSARAL